MKKTRLDERFFESTRGRVVTLLRGGARTVEELAEQLGLTNNAVRAHLATLERDRLVAQRGVRRGLRKPHHVYALTAEADHLFPKAYDDLLNRLIDVLKGRLAPGALEAVLREVGRLVARDQPAADTDEGREARVRRARKVLETLGGAVEVGRRDDAFVLESNGCPLATAVSEHPEVCQLAEALVAEIVGAPAREECDRAESPRCRFLIADDATVAE
ncbi:MAG: helix-turn-helix transcriptional regulator [Pyrinomonadaceae bacterium]